MSRFRTLEVLCSPPDIVRRDFSYLDILHAWAELAT